MSTYRFKTRIIGAEEIALQLKALVALAENLGSVLNFHIVVHKQPPDNSHSRGSAALFQPPRESDVYTWYIYIHASKILIHIQ